MSGCDEAIRPRMNISFPLFITLDVKKSHIIVAASNKQVPIVIIKCYCADLSIGKSFPYFPSIRSIKEINITFSITGCNQRAVMRKFHFMKRDIVQVFFPDELSCAFIEHDLFKLSRILALCISKAY